MISSKLICFDYCRSLPSLALLLSVLVVGWIFIFVYPIKLLLINGESSLTLTIIACFRFCLYYWFFQITGYWFYKILPLMIPSVKEEKQTLLSEHPKIAIIIPIRNEPEVVIRRMLEALMKVDYPHYEVVIVDNSSSSLKFNFNHFVQKSKFSLRVVRKEDAKGFKAGALNCALKVLDNQVVYVLILDVDHAPRPNILKILVPFLQANAKRAFVQAPQRFEIKGNKTLSRAYSFQQSIFYNHICPGMSTLNTPGHSPKFRR